MAFKEKMKKVGPLIIFNIILPTIDILTDLLMIIKLFEGAFRCNEEDKGSNAFQQCKAFGPNNFCSSISSNCRSSAENPFFSKSCSDGDAKNVLDNTCLKKGHPIFALGKFSKKTYKNKISKNQMH